MILIFTDLDGTLEDSRADMVAAARRVRSAFGLPPEMDERLAPHVNRGMGHLYRNCFAELFESLPDASGKTGAQTHSAGEGELLEAIRVAYEADYAEHIVDQTRAYDGIPEAVAELAQLGTLVCFTNKPEALSRLLLDRLGLLRYYARIMGGDSAAESKPSALPMRIAAEALGFDPDAPDAASVMIGDTAGDMRAARDFGARSIWCAWGYQPHPPEDPQPAAVANDPRELPALIRAGLPR